MIKILTWVSLLLMFSPVVIGQRVAINENGTTGHASSMLHVQSTTKGLLIPRMDSAQRTAIASPANGLLVYDTQTRSFWFWSIAGPGQWVEMRDMTDDRFLDGTHGMYTSETGIGVGAAPSASYQKFYGLDSIHNTVHLALRNKHASGKSAFYLLNQTAAISGSIEFDNTDKHLYLWNATPTTGGDIVFRTNQFPGSTTAEVMRLERLGNVGIGVSNPDYKLQVENAGKRALHLNTEFNSSASDTVYGIFNEIEAVGVGVHYGFFTKVFINPSNASNVYGVRAQVEPEGTGLHWGVYARANGDDNIGVEGISSLGGIGVKGTNTNDNGWAGYFDGHTYIQNRLEISDKIFLKPTGNASSGEIELYDNDGDETVTIRAAQATNNGAQVHLYNDANDLTIELDAEGAGNAGAIILADEDGDQNVFIRASQSTTNGAEMLLYNEAGDLTIEIDADYNVGKGRVITDELEITGGSDLAEHFQITGDVALAPGTLVSLDPSGNGNLIPTSNQYDKRVAGVISGANGVSPGMLMGQRGSIADGEYPVALVGRVYVLADATKRSIKPGDLMTSSSIIGHAMSVKNHRKAQGAIIGKAITELKEGTGYVLILVNLQ